ncbi:HpcH/HpaI aldolase/citrate lyase family protein [Streptomyces sp. NPDC056296]|uniref:HpcH/HpaI aldolase family protein n=1 Tax=Streptomyces sp. NPDC056296 TaxID=3345775 RepID=UPI0035DA64BB
MNATAHPDPTTPPPDTAGLRRHWSAGRPRHGVWSLLPGAVTAELLARTGPDFVVLDLQHGAVGEAELPGTTAAIRAAGSVPLVRTRSAHFADIGRPLDLGACGVFVPNVLGADHVREVVASCRYGPSGKRSIGRLAGGSEAPLVLAVLETAAALDDLDAILDVEGLDGIYVGPTDLALSLGRADEESRNHMREVVASVVDRAVAARMPVGVHTYDGATAAVYAGLGATVVTATVESTALAETVRRQLAAARAG